VIAILPIRRGALAACAALAVAGAPGARADDVPAVVAATASPQAAPPPWTFVELPDQPAQFHGIVNMDNAGQGSGAMLYPVGNLGLVGLFVGIATHAAIVGGTRSAQETKMQAEADKVLDPYRDLLGALRLRALQQQAIDQAGAGASAHLRPLAEAPAGELVLQAAPQFSMTPDGSALVLDETVAIGHAASTDTPASLTIRVVSPERPEADLKAAWSADGGAALKTTAVSLLAESIRIALARGGQPADDKSPARTIRYKQGGAEKMERGQLLDETCERMLVRTLRGGLLAVPHRAEAVLPAGCPTPPAIARHVAPGADGFDPGGGAAAAPVAPSPAASVAAS
jgi:hypothetical protein